MALFLVVILSGLVLFVRYLWRKNGPLLYRGRPSSPERAASGETQGAVREGGDPAQPARAAESTPAIGGVTDVPVDHPHLPGCFYIVYILLSNDSYSESDCFTKERNLLIPHPSSAALCSPILLMPV